MFLSGVVSLATYFSNEYWMTVGYVITYGFLDGSFIGLMSLVTLEIVGMDDLAQGFGLMLTSIGVPIALGPYLIGKKFCLDFNGGSLEIMIKYQYICICFNDIMYKRRTNISKNIIYILIPKAGSTY